MAIETNDPRWSESAWHNFWLQIQDAFLDEPARAYDRGGLKEVFADQYRKAAATAAEAKAGVQDIWYGPVGAEDRAATVKKYNDAVRNANAQNPQVAPVTPKQAASVKPVKPPYYAPGLMTYTLPDGTVRYKVRGGGATYDRMNRVGDVTVSPFQRMVVDESGYRGMTGQKALAQYVNDRFDMPGAIFDSSTGDAIRAENDRYLAWANDQQAIRARQNLEAAAIGAQYAGSTMTGAVGKTAAQLHDENLANMRSQAMGLSSERVGRTREERLANAAMGTQERVARSQADANMQQRRADAEAERANAVWKKELDDKYAKGMALFQERVRVLGDGEKAFIEAQKEVQPRWETVKQHLRTKLPGLYSGDTLRDTPNNDLMHFMRADILTGFYDEDSKWNAEEAVERYREHAVRLGLIRK